MICCCCKKLLFICCNWPLIGDDDDDFTHSTAVSIITGLRVEYRCNFSVRPDSSKRTNKTKTHTSMLIIIKMCAEKKKGKGQLLSCVIKNNK